MSMSRRSGFLSFSILGFHVGVYAVQIAPLAAALQLSPVEIGFAATIASLVGLTVRLSTGRLIDRLGRRWSLAIGFGGTAIAFVALAAAHSLATVYVAFILYGLFISWVDIGANSLGADLESVLERHVMLPLHASFSAGAMTGAFLDGLVLSGGFSFRGSYAVLAIVFVATAVALCFLQIPVRAVEPVELERGRKPRRAVLLADPLVLLCIAMIVVTFYGDSSLESFLSVYLNRTLGATLFLTGLGIALFHAASLASRLISTRVLSAIGERAVIVFAGLLAAAGILVSVLVSNPRIALIGLFFVGFAVAPVVPLVFSLAGRAGGARAGQAIALTSAFGSAAFILSPSLVGVIASLGGLRMGIGTVAISSLAIAALGLAWPSRRARTPQQQQNLSTPETKSQQG